MMTDSTDNAITYKRIQDRAMEDAKERMPEFPEDSSGWQDFIDQIEEIDAYDVAHESCEWDWVIYYHRALELCQAVPGDVLHEAEAQWYDLGQSDAIDDSFGLYELAAQLAAQIVIQEIASAVEQVREEMLEVANDALDNMESE